MAKAITLGRTLARHESLLAVFLALLIPVVAAGGGDFMSLAGTLLR